MADDGGRPRESVETRLKSLTIQVRTMSDTLEEVRGKVRDLPGDPSERLDKAEAKLDRFLAAAVDAAPPPFDYDGLEPDERAKREQQVQDWVRDILIPWFPTYTAILVARPCWWDHLEARAMVTNNWLAWIAGHRHAGRRGTDPDDWSTRRLPALETALERILGKVRAETCTACEREAARRAARPQGTADTRPASGR